MALTYILIANLNMSAVSLKARVNLFVSFEKHFGHMYGDNVPTPSPTIILYSSTSESWKVVCSAPVRFIVESGGFSKASI